MVIKKDLSSESLLLSMKASAVFKKPRFAKRSKPDFFSTLKKRVDAYFKEKNISTHANFEMVAKTVLIITSYFGLIFAIYTDYFTGWSLIGIYLLLGFFSTLNGLNIAHDANHCSYSKYPWINHLLASIWDFSGPSSSVWRYSHNIQHHIYTNVPGMDNDIDKSTILRLSPTDPLVAFNAYQHLYAPFLYCLSTLNWVFLSDFVWFFKERREGEMTVSDTLSFFGFKIANIVFLIFLPMMILSAPWWQFLVGFLGLHAVAGITSAFVFQLGHVVEGVKYIEPGEDQRMPHDWIEHEMLTSSNFATKNWWISHLVGGLNFQIEHHLFPQLCHIHYYSIAGIVEETAKEFNLPYNEIATFPQAIASHLRMLKLLGNEKAEHLMYGKQNTPPTYSGQ